MNTADNTIIRLRGVAKRFPGVLALDHIDLDIARGSCHALIGENGAGKSTLGKVLAGILQPDSGQILLNGQPIRFTDSSDAIRAGIGMVHQELLFCENLTVAENLALDNLPSIGPFLSRKRMMADALRRLAVIEAPIDPGAVVGGLSISQQQLIQIAAAVSRGAHVLIFDEPTSSISRWESERLFLLIQRLKTQGTTLLYVSHRHEEIFRLCDTITVMRDGRIIATQPAGRYTENSMVEQMIGRPLAVHERRRGKPRPRTELLRVEGLGSPGRFRDISFSLFEGEVLGLAGLVGAGRTEIAEAIFGLDPQVHGRVFIRGRPIMLNHPRKAMDNGLGLVPEDRKRHGLTLTLNVRENISLPILNTLSTATWIRRREENRIAADFIQRLRVRTPGIDASVAGLSGGNQQKTAMARWLAARCAILIMDEPTRGIDVAGKTEIHDLIDQLASQGGAILMISSDLPELLRLSDRILVIREGQLAGELSRNEATQNILLRLMAGIG